MLICGRLFSARSFCEFRAFCGNIFSPTDFTDLHRYLWCAVLPQNSQNTQNLAAWVCSRDAIPSYICAHPCHLWESFLCKRFCVFGVFRGSFFTACSVGAAEAAAPPGLAAWVWQGCHTLLHLCSSVPSVGVLSLQEVLCIWCIPWESLSSHGFHRFTQILRVRCSPTEFTEFGSVGMAGMPYPPTSVLIRVICGSPFSARGSVYSVGASSPLVRLVQLRLLHPLA